MAPSNTGSPLHRFLNRSETYIALRTFPSVLRGRFRALLWKDEMLGRLAGGPAGQESLCDHTNPLRDYFDSVTKGRGIWKWLHYFDIYHRHFRKFVGREVHVVEVGIYSGGGLDMWKAYFGPKCKVYGVDIEDACRTYADDRTEVFIGDQGDRDFWGKFKKEVPDVDILIDDGGHAPEQQIVTLEEILPHLRPGGVYLCEDILGTQNRFAAYLDGLTSGLNAFAPEDESQVSPGAFQRSICSIHLYPFVAVIEKACHAVDGFSAVRHGTQWQPFL